MQIFRGEDHIERAGTVRGATFSPDQMWQLARTWYSDRADPGWQRRSAAEAEEILAAIGLQGDFWRLSG